MTLDELYLGPVGDAISEDEVEDQQDGLLGKGYGPGLGTGVWSWDSYCKHFF